MGGVLRIFQGVMGQAGQPYTLAKGFRALGHEAQSFSVAEHPFGYITDELIRDINVRDPSQIHHLVEKLADRFDVFHFHGRAFVPFIPDLQFPCFNDILHLKLLGKKIFFHFRGGELRDRKKFDEVNPFAYSYEKDSDDLFGRLGDDYKRLMKQVISELCTDVFVVDIELATYLPGAKIMPRAVDLSDWPFVGPTSRDRPLVIHAPNRRVVKGTDYILKAVEELKAKGVDFDFWLVEGLSNIEARELYKQADIVIDQLRIGWYGVLAVEAMALGKTVIAYIREDLLQVEENTLPLINANPNTIKDILEQTINDGPLRKRLSFEAREYVERVHGSEAVCIRLLEAYKTPNHRDLGHSLLDLQGYQNYQWMLKGSAALRKKIDDGKSPIPTTSKARFRLACRIIKASLYSRN